MKKKQSGGLLNPTS